MIGGAEVTEWIEPCRKRDKEYSGDFVPIRDMPDDRQDPLERLRVQLERKYGRGAGYSAACRMAHRSHNVGRMGLTGRGWEVE